MKTPYASLDLLPPAAKADLNTYLRRRINVREIQEMLTDDHDAQLTLDQLTDFAATWQAPAPPTVLPPAEGYEKAALEEIKRLLYEMTKQPAPNPKSLQTLFFILLKATAMEWQKQRYEAQSEVLRRAASGKPEITNEQVRAFIHQVEDLFGPQDFGNLSPSPDPQTEPKAA